MKPKTKVKRTRDEKVGKEREGSRAYDRRERERERRKKKKKVFVSLRQRKTEEGLARGRKLEPVDGGKRNKMAVGKQGLRADKRAKWRSSVARFGPYRRV